MSCYTGAKLNRNSDRQLLLVDLDTILFLDSILRSTGGVMQKQHATQRVLLLLVAMVAVIALTVGVLPQRYVSAQPAAQGNNLLQNGSFEGDYSAFEGDNTRKMAAGWSPWNVARKANDPGFVNLTPEYRAAQNPKRVRGGNKAQEWLTFFATHKGGIFQRVAVTQGSQLKFTAFVNVWSTSLDNNDLSEQPGGVIVRVGIDPLGGTDGTSPNIVWATAPEVYDQYQQVSVDATAKAGFVTVFVESAPRDPVKNNNTYVDDASLVVTGGAPAGPTNTPITPTVQQPTVAGPTREGTIVPDNNPTVAPVVPSNTPIPTFTPQPANPNNGNAAGKTIYTVVAGDTLNSIAQRFASTVALIVDANGLGASGLIFVGQQLVIPAGPTPTPLPSTATPISTRAAPVDTAILTGPTLNGIGTYIVQPGDDLQHIAAHYGLTIEALSQLNGIVNPSQVVIGTVLVVPGPGNNVPGGTIAPTVLPTPLPSAKPQTHTVAVGENLFRIALKYGVTLDALMRANNISNANLVFVGQVLRIP
jgi:LysM repeat protein